MKKGFNLKRLLSVVLSLCLILSTGVCGTTYSVAAAADEPQDFVVEHDHDGWTPLNEVTTATQYIPSGNYYLEDDMELTKTVYYVEKGDVTICLNGHTLKTGSRKISVYTGSTLTVTDCTDEGVITGGTNGPISVRSGTFILENGTISGNKYHYGGAVFVYEEGTFIMKGGSISDNNLKATGTVLGGGVYMRGGTFIMEGGTISGNKGALGGGVCMEYDANFIMRGGSISGNYADGTAKTGGGGVCMVSGTFTMEGGTISGNTSDLYCGGVSVVGGVFTMKGGEISDNSAIYGGGVYVRDSDAVFIMENGTIFDNTVTSNGGGVYMENGFFTLKDGTISNNIATTNGGGVYMNDGMFTMEGGTISGNTAGTDGGGVFVHDTMIVSGTPVVADNTLSDKTTLNNITLILESTNVLVEGALTDGAKLGVHRLSDVKETPVLTTGYSEYHSDDAGKYFFYDNAESFGNCDVGTGPDGEAWFGYNVTFKDTSEQTLEEQFVGYNCTATPLDDNYWSTEIGGAEFDFDTPITENLTLYSAFDSILNPMSSQIRFKRNADGSYANKFDVRSRAQITDGDFAKYIAETNEEAVKNISKVGFVYACSSTDFSIADAQKVAKGETVSGYTDAPVSYIQDADGYYMFTCIITDIPAADVEKGVTAYAYICVEDKWYFYNAETTVNFKELYEANYFKAAEEYGW